MDKQALGFFIELERHTNIDDFIKLLLSHQTDRKFHASLASLGPESTAHEFYHHPMLVQHIAAECRHCTSWGRVL